jgi:molecular chaperone GrpE
VSGTARNSAGAGKSTPAEDIDEAQPNVVIRDKRKIRRDAPDKPKPPGKPDGDGPDEAAEEAVVVGEIVDPAEVTPDVVDEATAGDARGAGPGQRSPVGETAAGQVVDGGPVDEADVDEAIVVEQGETVAASGVLGAELDALRADVDERTRDLQRVSAEYANYRKRVERDRALVGEQATGAVLAALLPVLDDLDRAREHGDLVGPFGTVAEQLTAALGKFGLTPFGEKGDPFDPTRHEAVAHLTSAEVTEPTCVDILRRGYLLGERLLRPALVAVADPE